VLREPEPSGNYLATVWRFCGQIGIRATLGLCLDVVRSRLRQRSVATLSWTDVLGQWSGPTHRVASLNDEQTVAYIREFAPDLIILAYVNELVQAPFLQTAAKACINCHGGPLPEYAGPNSGYFVLADGRSESSGTLHIVELGIDSGNVLAQERFPVAPDETVRTLGRKTAEAICRGLTSTIPAYREGMPEGQPQDRSRRRYFSKLNPEVMRRLRAHGHRVL